MTEHTLTFPGTRTLELPRCALELYEALGQRAIPQIAKDPELLEALFSSARRCQTEHRILLGDSRERLHQLQDESVALALTSPPYWTPKDYVETPGQLGAIEDYKRFLDELDRVWREVFRVLVPGGWLMLGRGLPRVVIHEPFAVDQDIVWTFVERHQPYLKEALRRALAELDRESWTSPAGSSTPSS